MCPCVAVVGFDEPAGVVPPLAFHNAADPVCGLHIGPTTAALPHPGHRLQ